MAKNFTVFDPESGFVSKKPESVTEYLNRRARGGNFVSGGGGGGGSGGGGGVSGISEAEANEAAAREQAIRDAQAAQAEAEVRERELLRRETLLQIKQRQGDQGKRLTPAEDVFLRSRDAARIRQEARKRGVDISTRAREVGFIQQVQAEEALEQIKQEQELEQQRRLEPIPEPITSVPEQKLKFFDIAKSQTIGKTVGGFVPKLSVTPQQAKYLVFGPFMATTQEAVMAAIARGGLNPIVGARFKGKVTPTTIKGKEIINVAGKDVEIATTSKAYQVDVLTKSKSGGETVMEISKQIIKPIGETKAVGVGRSFTVQKVKGGEEIIRGSIAGGAKIRGEATLGEIPGQSVQIRSVFRETGKASPNYVTIEKGIEKGDVFGMVKQVDNKITFAGTKTPIILKGSVEGIARGGYTKVTARKGFDVVSEIRGSIDIVKPGPKTFNTVSTTGTTANLQQIQTPKLTTGTRDKILTNVIGLTGKAETQIKGSIPTKFIKPKVTSIPRLRESSQKVSTPTVTTKVRTDTKASITQGSISLSATRISSGLKTETVTKTGQQSKQFIDVSGRTRQKQDTGLRTILRTPQVLRIKTPQRPKTFIGFTSGRPPKFPRGKGIVPFGFKLKGGGGISTSGKFGVAVRRKKKYQTIGSGLSLQKAINIGKSKVAGTLAATYKIIPTSKGSISTSIRTPFGFKQKKGLVFIEQPKYRLSTLGEVGEIRRLKRRRRKK